MPTGKGSSRPAPAAEDRRLLSEHASSETILDALLSAQDAIYVKDRAGRYLMVNPSGAANLGHLPEDLVGKTDREVFPGELGERLWRSDQAIMASALPRTVEEPVIVAGRLRTYLSTKAPLRDSSGAIIGLVGASTDVTSLSEADEEVRRREAQLAEALALIEAGSWEWAVAGGKMSWSGYTYSIVGRDPDEFEPTFEAFLECVHPDDRQPLLDEVAGATEPGSDGSYQLEHRIVRPDGAERVCNCRGQVFFDLDGTPTRMIGAVQDVTEQRQAEADLMRAQRQLSIAQELTGVGSFDWDPGADRVTWSEGLYRIFGLLPDEFDGTFEGYLERLHPEDRAAGRERVERALKGGDTDVSEARILRSDDEIRVIRSYMRVLRDDSGRLLRLIGACEDVTERRRAELDLERRALRDPLTGLANRSLAFDRLRHALELARRRESTLAVLFIDLDGFKRVNDELGHEAGDQVLVGAADRLRELVRASDTLGRVGGDEFIAICEDVESVDAVLLAAERVRGGLAAPFRTGGQECRLSASVGIAFATGRHEAPEDLLRDADRAMYLAKQAGGNRAAVSQAQD